MTNRIVGEVFVRNDWLDLLVDRLEIISEEIWLNLGELIELNESVLKHSLVLLSEGLGDHVGHKGKQLDEVLRVLSLSDGQVVGDSLEGGKLNVQALESERPLKNTAKLILELDQVVKDVAEQAIEDNESGIDLSLGLTLDECEERVEQLLPDTVVLLIDHGALDLDSQIADLVHVGLVGGIDTLERLKDGLLDCSARTI